jgi:hypothetical protein
MKFSPRHTKIDLITDSLNETTPGNNQGPESSTSAWDAPQIFITLKGEVCCFQISNLRTATAQCRADLEDRFRNSLPGSGRKINGGLNGKSRFERNIREIQQADKSNPSVYGLLFEEIKKGLTMAVHGPADGGSCSAALLLDENFGLKENTQVVCALIGDADLNGLHALIAGRRIKVQAVAAGVQIRAAGLAFICNLNLLHHLDLCGAIVAACDQLKPRLDTTRGSLRPWRRFGPALTLEVLITGLTILSIHLLPRIKRR